MFLIKMSDVKNSSFKSYIDESEFKNITLSDGQKTKLFEGEQFVCDARGVIHFTPLSDRKISTSGILTITTFKLSFVTNTDDHSFDDCYQQNLLLGSNEICLSAIDTIYQIGERSKKKLHGQIVSGKVKELLIMCKNMRTFHFSFKKCEKDTGNKIAAALLNHAFPKRHSLLFAYDFKEPYYKQLSKDVRMFRNKDDWKREIERTKCKGWRISDVNRNFIMSPLLPQYIVVPISVTDDILSRALEHFRNRFCPLWVWSSHSGSALVRTADILPTITDRTQENTLLEHIRKSHSEKRPPFIMDLTKDCPSPKDVYLSFCKLRELCTPDNIRLFKTQDFKFYGLLDNTKWLLYVSICLTQAVKAAEELSEPNATTVVLQEGTGQDLNCIVSSLTQILLDSHWRTMYGFESLIQKDWVSLGHHFAYRLGHIINEDVEQSPLFLLFLDCVWQLLQQYPTAFQFSETYLTTVWDTAHISIFETFIFNCEHDRDKSQKRDKPLILRSAWDWSEQFLEKDIALFCNPLYDDSFKEILRPNTKIPFLEIWLQCYFRWLPDLEIRNGGRSHIDLCNRFITRDIHALYQKLNSIEVNGTIRTKEENLQFLKKINGFFPFSYNNNKIESFPVNNELLSSDVIDSQSILNLNID